jgi:SAM-dependent methyltransferase
MRHAKNAAAWLRLTFNNPDIFILAMGTIAQNRYSWDVAYDWKHQGSEWSKEWGGVEMQWHASILPRIHAFVPARCILEIGPGFGRWTHFLKDLCDRLIIVDLSEKCIRACQHRFNHCSHISYHINDGLSLDAAVDGSVDFVFSFDSLVHVEMDVIESYLRQLAAKLTPNGVGFIHHSNLGEYAAYFSWLKKIPKGKIRNALSKLRIIERKSHWRAFSMSAERFDRIACGAGLQCISQEVVNWKTSPKRLIDCLSVFTRKGSIWERPIQRIRNDGFMREAAYLSKLSRLYGSGFSKKNGQSEASQDPK